MLERPARNHKPKKSCDSPHRMILRPLDPTAPFCYLDRMFASVCSHFLFLAQAAPNRALIQHPVGVLAVLLAALTLVFQLAQHPGIGRIFKFVPALVFCYFIPTALTTCGLIPNVSPLYAFVKDFVLPACLLLIILALDLPALVRLGPKALIMMLAGCGGVIIGGPLSLWFCTRILPERYALPTDIWRGMTAISGSWIGGNPNFVALGKIAGTSDELLAAMVVPDVFVANCWLAVLLFSTGFQKRIDRRIRADASAIDDLRRKMSEFQEQVRRIPTVADLLLILAVGFGASWICHVGGDWLSQRLAVLAPITWKFILLTTGSVLLSLTPARKLEGAGASKIGTVLIYILIACVGAGANFRTIGDQPAFILMTAIWMLFHAGAIIGVAILIRAPLFYAAVASQANIGGAASAPAVAAAFHPSLAPVGALLAILGYVLGTYGGLVCMKLLKWTAGAE